jgi:hypothetical protein
LLFQDTGNQTWNEVLMISSTDGFVVGNGGLIRRWQSGNWTTAPTSGTTQNLNAVHCSSATNCFAVGGSGQIVRWTGGPNWSPYAPLPATQNLNSVFLLASNNGWAVGNSGVILHLTGGGYETSGTLESLALNMIDASPVQLIGWDESIPICVPTSACNIKFQICMADNPAMTGAVCPPDFTVAAGTIIPYDYNGNQYVQYQVKLIGDGASTPVLQEVRINYK